MSTVPKPIKKKRLNIIHCDTDDIDNPLGGGQPVRTFEINRRLAQHHNIKVYTAVFKNSSDLIRNNVRYKRIGCYIKPLGLSPHLSFIAQLGPRIALSPHDIIVEEFMPPFGFSLTPLWTPKPVISIVQWYFFDFWEQKYKLPFKTIMKKIAATGLYKHFIVQTKAMGSEIASHIPDATINTIPCGINQKEFLNPVTYDDYVLFLGRIDRHQKGLDMLVNIWKKISVKAKIPLVIAGDGPWMSELKKQMSTAGLADHVRYMGKVGGPEKEKLLAGCRFMVMPSRNETFGLTALEAMAASKPCVAFNIPNLNEVVRPDWGELIECWDMDKFAAQILNFWHYPDYCKQKGINGARIAKHFLWDNIAQMQNDVYLKTVNACKQPL